uniref:carboxypeptidase-like regulatory domain-containing protein n=1 Tax=uncultured Draconibacterium sp. TaxID=1573823 RepID=UPI0032177DD7
MNRYLPIIILLFCGLYTARSQVCKGRVVDSENGEPIRYASVFLNRSSIGTITDEKGHFELDLKNNSAIPLIVSCIGYQTVLIEPEFLLSNLKVELKKKIYEIDNVDVASDACSWSRKKMLRIFYREFIGSTRRAKSCTIENVDDIYLYYNDETKTLHASSKVPIMIRNKALGYNIFFLLDYFIRTDKKLSYYGYSTFKEHIFSGKRDIERTEARRRSAYERSFMRFVRSLYVGTLETNRYVLSKSNGGKLNLNEVVSYSSENKKQICYNGTIVINILWHIPTYLRIKEKCMDIDSSGYYNPELVELDGFWGIFRVGDMLPFDYVYED